MTHQKRDGSCLQDVRQLWLLEREALGRERRSIQVDVRLRHVVAPHVVLRRPRLRRQHAREVPLQRGRHQRGQRLPEARLRQPRQRSRGHVRREPPRQLDVRRRRRRRRGCRVSSCGGQVGGREQLAACGHVDLARDGNERNCDTDLGDGAIQVRRCVDVEQSADTHCATASARKQRKRARCTAAVTHAAARCRWRGPATRRRA